MSTFEAFFGSELETKEGRKPTSEVLANAKSVGIYFSAHWCPPCRQFTPVLAEFYLSAKELEEDGLEIIFVSSDRDEDSFKEYYGSQPWTSLPFEDKEHKQALAQKFGVSGIPMLVILDAAGNLKDASGRNTVSASRGNVSDCFSKWHN